MKKYEKYRKTPKKDTNIDQERENITQSGGSKLRALEFLI